MNTKLKSYQVLAALKEDINQGWVWMQDESLKLQPRSIVKITNRENKKSIFCECLIIDKNFKNSYNGGRRVHIKAGSTLIMNEWYHSKLGKIETKKYHNLCIEPRNDVFGKYLANINHPQVIVRMAVWLGTIGVLLGIVGVVS